MANALYDSVPEMQHNISPDPDAHGRIRRRGEPLAMSL